jgi:hypothetical protein
MVEVATLVIVAGIIVFAVGMKMTIHDLGAEGKHRSDERWSASVTLARASRRDVFEEAAEIAEADRGVDAFRGVRGLEAGRLTSSRERVVDVESGERGCQSAPTGVLEGSGVVNPTVAAVIECHRGGDVLAAETSDQNVVGARVGAAEEVRRHTGQA